MFVTCTNECTHVDSLQGSQGYETMYKFLKLHRMIADFGVKGILYSDFQTKLFM